MSLPWPGFLRRRALFERARAALERRDLVQALELLSDPALRGEPRADELLAAQLDQLALRAAVASDGPGADEGATADPEALSLLARHAPERALAIQRDLARRASFQPPTRRISSLLGELRARSRVEAAGTAAENAPRMNASDDAASDEARPARPRAAEPAAPPYLFHLAVDDGGEFVAAIGRALTIGHLRSRDAELPLLADIESRHARLSASESFHGGLRWRLEPVLGAHDGSRPSAISWRGRELPLEGAELAHGDRIALARNATLRLVAPDAASSSAILELERGLECHGASRVLLLAPGPAGRVRLGRKRTRMIAIGDLEHDVTLELTESGLVVECDGGLSDGRTRVEPAPRAQLAIPLPLAGPVYLAVGARTHPRPPFQITLRPLDSTPAGGS